MKRQSLPEKPEKQLHVPLPHTPLPQQSLLQNDVAQVDPLYPLLHTQVPATQRPFTLQVCEQEGTLQSAPLYSPAQAQVCVALSQVPWFEQLFGQVVEADASTPKNETS